MTNKHPGWLNCDYCEDPSFCKTLWENESKYGCRYPMSEQDKINMYDPSNMTEVDFVNGDICSDSDNMRTFEL
jgi:hypothetical protein